MGATLDLFKKGNFVENPYSNFYEIKAKDISKNLVKMDQYTKKTLLVVNISPYDPDFEKEIEKLIEMKNYFKNNFEILLFPSSQLDKIEVSDREMAEVLLNKEIIKNNLDKLNIFNRIYLNGHEVCEVFKYCYRNSSLYMHREAKSEYLKQNFTKFLISNNGSVYDFYKKEVDKDEIEKNVEYLISQKAENVKIRDDFTYFNKYY